jgi:hypothetical protein
MPVCGPSRLIKDYLPGGYSRGGVTFLAVRPAILSAALAAAASR